MAFSAPGPGDARVAADPGEPELTTNPLPDPPAAGMSTGAPRNPLLAVLGAGDAAVAAVARAFSDAFAAAADNRKGVQQRVAELPAELEALRGRFSADELRRALDAYRGQVERTYTAFAGRGGEAWSRLREQPQVRQTITALEAYGDRLDERVDELVDTATAAATSAGAAAQGTATRVLDTAGRQRRDAGDRVAGAGRRLSGRAADAVLDATAVTADAVEDAGVAAVDVSAATADAVEDAGTAAAGALEDAGRAGGDAAEDAAEQGEQAAAARPVTTRTATTRTATTRTTGTSKGVAGKGTAGEGDTGKGTGRKPPGKGRPAAE